MTPEHGGRLKAMPEARDTGAKSVIPPHLVRLARMDDLGTLVAIVVAAGAAFRDLGMDARSLTMIPDQSKTLSRM
jgi:hypothetical protein